MKLKGIIMNRLKCYTSPRTMATDFIVIDSMEDGASRPTFRHSGELTSNCSLCRKPTWSKLPMPIFSSGAKNNDGQLMRSVPLTHLLFRNCSPFKG